MNAVEIEAALSELALMSPFDSEEFPYAFLAAFGNKETTIQRLRRGGSNASDIPGGVLQRNNVHIAVAAPAQVGTMLNALRASPKTAQAKAKFILATDGTMVEAEELASGEAIACDYAKLPDHFGFFLPLAGISTIKEIKDNPIDVRATGRLNKLYVELLRENPDWAKADRRADMNHFMARLIFCFFAEDTDIFAGEGLFTRTVDQMSERDASNTHEVLSTLFRAMNLTSTEREAVKPPRWATAFPYVNGGLFSGGTDVPRFSRTARSYLFRAGQLNWKAINPDIFGSMIQAVADDEERGALGMHYTSVPNILKVLNPLFLDDLRAHLEAAGDNKAKLFNLRRRIARIRVFDPACGSGNFVVIAYKQMREIEADINRRRGERHLKSEIPLTNFRGIELREFPAEIARLALIIAEFQCDVLYRGQKEALKDVLPLDAQNWITCGNALRLDWLAICPPTGTGVKLAGDDLFNTPLEQAEIDFENEGGETYICGNPPYVGNTWQTKEQKADIRDIVNGRTSSPGFLDYVAGWFIKASDWIGSTRGVAAFVCTNSVCQGQSVPILWPIVYGGGCDIRFAYTSFKWANLASHNAGVTVAIVGIGQPVNRPCRLYLHQEDGTVAVREGSSLTPYLTVGPRVIVEKSRDPNSQLGVMEFGNKPSDGGHLLLTRDELEQLNLTADQQKRFICRIYGSEDFIKGGTRFCIWIDGADLDDASLIPAIRTRIEAVRKVRLASPDKGARALAKRSHQLKLMRRGVVSTIIVPAISSERRQYLPVGLLSVDAVINNKAFGIYDGALWNLALVASRLHWVWIGTVCVRMRTDFSYSNTLGWNTFPLPRITDQNKSDLTRCAEDILLAREAHHPATIAELYDPDTMPEQLRRAHERNDEVLERIYIGRRFRNDTERLEKLFELYIKATAEQARQPANARKSQ
jgi:hypothetical protein